MSSSWELKLCFVLRVANDASPPFRGPMTQLWRETHTKEQHSWLNNVSWSATLFLRQEENGAPQRRLLERQGPVLTLEGRNKDKWREKENDPPGDETSLVCSTACEEARLIRADHLRCVNIFKTGKICWSKYIFIYIYMQNIYDSFYFVLL